MSVVSLARFASLSVATIMSAMAAEPSSSDLRAAGLELSPSGLITRAPLSQPNAAQRRQIEQTRYGMFIHYGINTFLNQEWTDGSAPVEKYAPKDIAAEEWVLAAKNAGMSHVVLVCKHHEGFCNWPTKLDELKYSVAHTANKTDVVKAVADACRKHGVRFAVYYSLWDRRWDRTHAADYKKDRAATDRAYTDYMIGQLTELLSNYGEVTELWFDGPWEKTPERWGYGRVYDAVKRLQPDCQVAINWCIGKPTGEHGANIIKPDRQKEGDPIRAFPCDFRLGDPLLPAFPDPKVFTREGKSYYMPWESTVCMNDKWFWNSGDRGLKSVDALEKLYYHATAQDNTLLLNSPPGPDGHMRPQTIQRLLELRARLGLQPGGPFPRNLSVKATASASSTWAQQGYDAKQAVDDNPNTRWSAAAGDKTPTLTQTFPAAVRVNRVLLREYSENQQFRVSSFILEAQVNGSWHELAKGDGIGESKMLDFPELRATALRLRIIAASDAPSLWSFWAYDTRRVNEDP